MCYSSSVQIIRTLLQLKSKCTIFSFSVCRILSLINRVDIWRVLLTFRMFGVSKIISKALDVRIYIAKGHNLWKKKETSFGVNSVDAVKTTKTLGRIIVHFFTFFSWAISQRWGSYRGILLINRHQFTSRLFQIFFAMLKELWAKMSIALW